MYKKFVPLCELRECSTKRKHESKLPELLHHEDVVQVHAGGGGGVDHPHDGVHAHGRQQAGVLRHHLGAQRGGGAVEQRLAVAQQHRGAHVSQDHDPAVHRLLEGLRDDGGVDACTHIQIFNMLNPSLCYCPSGTSESQRMTFV